MIRLHRLSRRFPFFVAFLHIIGLGAVRDAYAFSCVGTAQGLTVRINVSLMVCQYSDHGFGISLATPAGVWVWIFNTQKCGDDR